MPSTIAVSSSTTGPKTHKQPSRKTKRAWRKNIDLTTVTTGLDNARAEKIITGDKGLLADQPASALFQTDTDGDATVQLQVRNKHLRLLKADEILAQRSAVPALLPRKRSDENRVTDGVLPSSKRKKNGVSHVDYQRLRKLAYGGDAGHNDAVEKQDAAEHDLWAASADDLVVQDPNLSFVDPPKPIRAPRTLSRAPVSLRADGRTQANVSKPDAGKSYNPTFEDWSALLAREGEKEVNAEKKRLRAAEEETARLEQVAKAAEEAEKENEEKEQSDYYESEWEGIQSDVDEAYLRRKRPQRKTPAERNKVERRRDAERLVKHEARMNERDQQARRITTLGQEVDAKEAARMQALVKFDDESEDLYAVEAEEQLRRRKLGKNTLPQASLELVLPDELQDSLRLLKPEGNLLNDRFRNVMIQGKVETRKPTSYAQSKKAKKKSTEKWSYKDWKL